MLTLSNYKVDLVVFNCLCANKNKVVSVTNKLFDVHIHDIYFYHS